MKTARKLALVALIWPVIAVPGPLDYQCTVLEDYVVGDVLVLFPNDHGKLVAVSPPVHVGARFAVDRLTGRVVGGPLDNVAAQSIKVLSAGYDTKPFVLVSEILSYNRLLVVREERQGAEKQFVGVTEQHVLTGKCK